ncbi:ABC transporter ATP-binding protein [Sporolactobacillus kofuensis]|uniref:ABC transporter ATP-binding protein n=1 Tax=Sporolactobacillus kofuensis TaxID=269672 RepID=A0ABW1WFI4_9BACL|nr:ABC transporter ATP-binding protein [Sporolactobacillus kofuensis]MCO7174881.1 ABC transporter ATP-binding protein [Sporolactobacillus kofuensis]
MNMIEKTDSQDPVLNIEHLTTKIKISSGEVSVIEDINLKLNKGEIMVVVGESGSGKSMTINSIMQLIPKKLLKGYEGSIKLDQSDLLTMNDRDKWKLRGNKISLVTQNAMTSLDPSYRVGKQIVEIILASQHVSKADAKGKTIDLLKKMGIEDPERIYQSYPHQLSGGLRQRVIIAMALSCNPEIIIADEPTSALDPTVQLQVLDLLKDVNRNFGTTILMITHDFGVVSYMADKVVVMYAGQIVETGLAKDVINDPQHPYTKSLLKCIPDLKWIYSNSNNNTSLFNIPGEVPDLTKKITGCRFAARCFKAVAQCSQIQPELKKVNALSSENNMEHLSRCIFAKED